MLLVLLGFTTLLQPSLQARDADSDLRHVLAVQVEAWNKGDLERFVEYYAEDCVMLGKQLLKGRGQVLANYRKAYPGICRMGTLAFDNLEIRPAAEGVAIVTGKFHLHRSAENGGPADGVFSLVFKNIDSKWQILLDHTS